MALTSRKPKTSTISTTKPKIQPDFQLQIPAQFQCPITLDVMTDPVMGPTGITYDRSSIETWLSTCRSTCPVSNQELKPDELVPNHTIRCMIQDWCIANRAHGVERIPTPRVPLTVTQAEDIILEIESTSRRRDLAKCQELVKKVWVLLKESERNKQYFMVSGAGRVLAKSFNLFASELLEDSSVSLDQVLKEILSVLVCMFPLEEETIEQIGLSIGSLNSIVSILNHGSDLNLRLNAILLVREIVSLQNREIIDLIANTNGAIEGLVKVIKHKISPQAMKSSLVTIFYIINTNDTAAERFIQLGLTDLLIEILVDIDKTVCERALAVLDSVLSFKSGRETAYKHALTVPVIVKKLFRVSDMGTRFAVSALWKLCKKWEGEREELETEEGGGRRIGCVIEALQAGAFHKLLLILQVGCSEEIKEKVTELLRVLNGFKGRGDCVDTMDFNGLKRIS